MELTQAALVCRALSDENRLQIVQMLTKGEMCACRLLADMSITQPTLSRHMKILTDCQLVSSRKDGKWIFYSLNCATLTAFRRFIAGLDCCLGKEAVE